ncbi:MAG: hypothetical protein LBV08_07565 [Clostridiales bacterium]|jgi:cytochrome c oxidase subunit 4|nr:hypothetical protein [Clostridiales bacterium]
MGYGWINVTSLLLGLLAWALPVINLVKRSISENKNWPIFAILSLGACSVSLFFQIIYQDYLARKEDWSAIMDTTGALVKVSLVLLIITFVLNVITVVAYSRRGK